MPFAPRLLRVISACLALAVVAAPPARADLLGWTVAHSNDSLGDQFDRWRSTSTQGSLLFGTADASPLRFGQVVEVRARADILTPSDIAAPDPRDRRFADILALGVHTHWQAGPTEWTAGADAVLIGPQTGLRGVQKLFHDVLGFPEPQADGFEIADTMRLALTAEAGVPLHFGPAVVRPFLGVETGPETLARAGVDVTLGALGRDDLKIRQDTGGHRLSALRRGPRTGGAITVGADIAAVSDSLYLRAVTASDTRHRLRIGGTFAWPQAQVFYGMSFLGPEFDAQPEGQRVGTLSLIWHF